MKPINVGLLGIGTVGGGTWDVLNRNADEIRAAPAARSRSRKSPTKPFTGPRRLLGKRPKSSAMRSSWYATRRSTSSSS